MKSKSTVDQIIGTGAPLLDTSKANSRDEMMHNAYPKKKKKKDEHFFMSGIGD